VRDWWRRQQRILLLTHRLTLCRLMMMITKHSSSTTTTTTTNNTVKASDASDGRAWLAPLPIVGFGPWAANNATGGCDARNPDRWPAGTCTLVGAAAAGAKDVVAAPISGACGFFFFLRRVLL
jgi:hypothetical protein